MSSKRKFFSLSDKMEILDTCDQEKLNCRTLVKRLKDKFGVGKISAENNQEREINSIIVNHMKMRKTSTHAVSEVGYQWFYSIRAETIPVSRSTLQEKAKTVSERLKITDF